MTLSKLSRSIEGKVAIVTGAASGMGRATAHLFGDEGARVALIDINAEPLASVVKEMTVIFVCVIRVSSVFSLKVV